METRAKDVIVAFEWRGRKLRFLGELNFQDLQKLYANKLFYKDRDKKGRFQKVKIYDEVGAIVSEDSPRGLIGCLNFDNEYNTVYCKYLKDCNKEELKLIENSNGSFLIFVNFVKFYQLKLIENSNGVYLTSKSLKYC